jgi:hypothetical protein
LKHETVLERWYLASGKASDNARNLAFAGIAVVWLLSGGSEHPTSATIEDGLVAPLLAFVATLFLDFMQYAVQAVIWRVFSRKKENELKARFDNDPAWAKEEFEVAPAMNAPGEVCFWLKLAVLALGYVLLGVQLVDRLA